MKGSLWMSRRTGGGRGRPWLRATAIGFPFGTMPAGGAEIPTFLSYAIEKKLTKHPEEFGKGAIEGVAGPGGGQQRLGTGALVPLLTLGMPTSATAAIMLGAFQHYGLQPGPVALRVQAELVWALIASLYVGNVMLLVLNLPMVGMWVSVLEMPRPLLYAGILVFADARRVQPAPLVGRSAAAVRLRPARLRSCARWDIPVAPGVDRPDPRAARRAQLRRALSISQGDSSVFVTRPISATLLGDHRIASDRASAGSPVPLDVLVIGAGAAGLAAGAELAHAGLKVLIVEAKNRIGGRCDTRRLPGLPVPVSSAPSSSTDGHQQPWTC